MVKSNMICPRCEREGWHRPNREAGEVTVCLGCAEPVYLGEDYQLHSVEGAVKRAESVYLAVKAGFLLAAKQEELRQARERN